MELISSIPDQNGPQTPGIKSLFLETAIWQVDVPQTNAMRCNIISLSNSTTVISNMKEGNIIRKMMKIYRISHNLQNQNLADVYFPSPQLHLHERQSMKYRQGFQQPNLVPDKHKEQQFNQIKNDFNVEFFFWVRTLILNFLTNCLKLQSKFSFPPHYHWLYMHVC